MLITKRTIFALHSWCGLIAGLFILVISLAGSFVALLHQYEGRFEKDKLMVVQQGIRLPYDSLFNIAKKQVPNFYLYDYARFPRKDDDAFEILYFPDGTYRSVFINPYNGRITGYINNNLSKWLLKFHWSLGIGGQGYSGAVIVFVAALCMVVSIATGFVIYKKHIIDALLFRIKVTRKNRFSGLHRIIGVWGMLFMLVVFCTGALLNYHIINGDYSYPGGRQLRQAPKQLLSVSVDSCLARAERISPSFIPSSFSFPQLMGGELVLSGNINGDNEFTQPSSGFVFDPSTGKITKVLLGKTKPIFSKCERVLFNLHYGAYGGVTVKCFYALFSLLSGFMPVSGFLLWGRKNKKFKSKQSFLKASL